MVAVPCPVAAEPASSRKMEIGKSLRIYRLFAGRLGLLLFFAVSQCGCLAARGQQPLPPDVRTTGARSVVFVADGAGNFQAASRHLRDAIDAARLPIDVHTYEWSHGYGRIVRDQVCFQRARAEGRALAEHVRMYHELHPEAPLYLFGHSAGAAVAIAAAEALPPGILERVILLSPALSAHYDVCPTLHNVKQGLHNFFSPRDIYYLGIYTHVIGTSDRSWAATSGRVGFRVRDSDCPPELLAKLHQRRWQPDDRELGNGGGHYGNYQLDFLRVHVLPLMLDASALEIAAPPN